jgi:hypothetical protein
VKIRHAIFALALCAAQAAEIPIAGTWKVRLNKDKAFGADEIFLPGSLDQGGYGTKTAGAEKDRLSRPYSYTGPAWYQREIVIPETWRGKRITLFLERPHWETQVWLDGASLGLQNSLSTPHVYELKAAPGKHTLTVCVDNTLKIDVGERAHSVTDWTQTNWNGITGRIELRATDPVWIDSVQVYPDGGEVRVEAVIGNNTGTPASGELLVTSGGKPTIVAVQGIGARQKLTLTLPMGDSIRRWDEHEPELYSMQLALSAKAGDLKIRDERQTVFGMRSFGTRGTQFVLNGRPVFLRGTLECVIFPKTGYPPTDVESWARLYRIARSYGLNHFRFHSWCPPEAAFVAADQAGFLLQVELPVWSNKVGKDTALNEYMRAEGQRIIEAYGNHPSFAMLCLGNELGGDFGFMDKLVSEFKSADPRHLYTFSADNKRRVPGPVSDYYVTHQTTSGRLRIHGTRFNKNASNTEHDFGVSVKEAPVPLVAHEIGQWVTHPDYREIAKYTGVLKPRNLEAFRDALAARGMLDQARDFAEASGRFSWLVYKEELETAFRTAGLGGFQLLQLQDFRGQGEALIGLLDSFWDSKGILTPEEFRRFCSETVSLLRYRKFVWTSDETFTAKAQVVHYGKRHLENAVGSWTLRDDAGVQWASGRFEPQIAGMGRVVDLGDIEIPLAGFSRAVRLTVTVKIEGTDARNDWAIWVYPKQAPLASPKNVLTTHALDGAARKRLEEGGRVLLLWPKGKMNGSMLRGEFLPVFWSLSFFPKQSGTMGILCDPKHPALANFPTEMHSNWQWWELTESAPVFILDDTPASFRPIVQVIDDYHRNHKLGAVIETRVGKGKLLAVSLDLETDLDKRPVARQLLYSLQAYAASEQFNPAEEIRLNW